MGTMIRVKTIVATVAMATAFTTSAAGQETLQHVKDLDVTAAYEDALGVLARLQSPDQRLEIERYRVYCLIALDRPAEAEKAILGILSEDPLYSPEDAAPRVVDPFKRVKRQAAPQIARSLYNDGKAAMSRKEQERAIRKFEQLLQVTEDAEIRNDALISELRMLASGFLDLARASAPPEAPTPAVTATIGMAPAPVTNAVPLPAPRGTGVRSGTTAPPAILARRRHERGRHPAGAAPSGPAALGADDNATRQAEYRGAIKVTIAADGKVQAAEIVTPTDRSYDRQLLNAARSWLYEPAKRDGVPIASEKIVAVYLRPR